MATICIHGGGFAGLSAGLLLARDGHDVTMVERDCGPSSPDPEEAWSSWTRAGVRHFRQTHAYMPKGRDLLRAELPHVWVRLLEAGVSEHNLAANPPPTVTDRTARAGDEPLGIVLGRRVTVEHVLWRCVEDDPRVDLISGVDSKGLLTANSGRAVPHVTGLVTEAGHIEADLVVDCGGRRSAVPDWIEEAGGTRPEEQSAAYRIAYWTQWFRTRPGASTPQLTGSPATEIGPIEVLRAPADNGWHSLTVVATKDDRRFRVLADQARLLPFFRRLELTAHWADPAVAEPVGGVQPMFPVVDQRRRFVVDGQPCATGIVAVGDALATSNPSLARGTSFALMQGVALRDLLRDGHVAELPQRYHDWLETQFEPWWQATLASDRTHLARMRAAATGDQPPTPDDPGWAFQHAAMHDPVLWRAGVELFGMLASPPEVLGRPGLADRIADTIARVGPPQLEKLDIATLLAP